MIGREDPFFRDLMRHIVAGGLIREVVKRERRYMTRST